MQAAVEAEKSICERELQTLRAQVGEMQTDSLNLKDRIKALEEQLQQETAALRQEAARMEACYTQCQTQNTHLLDEKAIMAQENELLAQEKSALQNDIVQLSREKYEALSQLNGIMTSRSYRLILRIKALLGR